LLSKIFSFYKYYGCFAIIFGLFLHIDYNFYNTNKEAL